MQVLDGNLYASKRLSKPRNNAFAPRFRGELNTATILNYWDNDDTLTIWEPGMHGQQNDPAATAAVAKLFTERPDYDKETVTAIGTGRALSGMQNIANLLSNVKIKILAASNSLTLFINKDNKPTPQWIRSLNPSKQDPKWKNELKERFGWDLDIVNQTMKDVLKQEGFHPAPAHMQAFDPNRIAWVKPSPTSPFRGMSPKLWRFIPPEHFLLGSFAEPDGNSIIFEKPRLPNGAHPALSSQEKAYTSEVENKIRQALTQDKHMQIKSRNFEYQHTMLQDFNPNIGDGKKLLLEFLIREYLPEVRQIIAAGDSDLDAEYLTLNGVQVPTKNNQPNRFVPLTAIQVGNNQKLKQALADHPSRLQVPSGGLADALQWLFRLFIDQDIQPGEKPTFKV